MNETISNVLKDNNILKDNTNPNLRFPCVYDNINKEFNNFEDVMPNQKLFIIHGADELCAKDRLWKNIVSFYDRTYAKKLTPESWILYDESDIKLFEQDYDPNKIYIMKKNIQRQEGLLITNNKREIMKGYSNGYVIVQELLQDPYLIDGRKTNMRFYVLFVCQNGDISCYVHNEGFMYYTKVPYKNNSLDHDVNVTTGYIDREVYERNPLTHGDLRVYLDSNRQLSDIEQKYRDKGHKLSTLVFDRIYELLKLSLVSMKSLICQHKKFKQNITFQLFGIDVGFNNQLIPNIIEINKGPDLGSKSTRDSQIKTKVCKDMLALLGTIDTDDNGYIKLFDTDNGVVL